MKKTFTVLLLSISFSLLKTTFVCAQTNPQDSLALVALYNSTNGQGWHKHGMWLTTAPISHWYGIYTNKKKIIGINLSDNNLVGTIPSVLGNLVDLDALNLSGNKLSGNIPSELGNLTNLEFLEMRGSELIGNIPAELGNLTKLSLLDLSNNQLGGVIPFELGNLTKVSDLHLNYNQLTGPIPSQLGNLINLNFLDLGNNQLSGAIPSELGNLINLYNLSLTKNQLTGSIPSKLGNLINLIFLDLGNNQLSGAIPVKLGNLINLIFLILSQNQLTGTIPSELGNLSNLNQLLLDNNRLSGNVPYLLFRLNSHIYLLHIDHNNLSGRLPSTINNLERDANLLIRNNAFTFSGLANMVEHFKTCLYSPQANINIHTNGGILSVYAGEANALAHNTYKWHKDGKLIATITGDSTYQATSSGVYYVKVINSIATQLTLYSDSINYSVGENIIASKMSNNSSVSVYPNPAKSFTTLSFNADGKYAITITNVSGKILQTKTGVALKGENTIQLDVSKYATGIYSITIGDEKSRKQTVRLNKE